MMATAAAAARTVAPIARGASRETVAEVRQNSLQPFRFLSSAPPELQDDSSLAGYFTSLRLRAVSALTTSLSADERHAVLESLHAVDKITSRNEASRSIGEAVAAAVRQESEQSEARWEREREAIEATADRAATERIEHELALAERRRGIDRWQKELESERQREKREQEQSRQQREEQTHRAVGDANDHPILGRPLIDLGYKRVHVVPARSLTAVPIWEKQRTYRHDRAKVMANDKLKTQDIGLPGIISLHEDTEGALSILDGQHRVGMMAILQEKSKDATSVRGGGGSFALDLERVLVEVFPHRDHGVRPKHADDIFTEINKAEPVKLVDMPGVALARDRKIIDGAAGAMKKAHPEMFKPSSRCRAPHLNLDNLRDALFAADVLKRHSIKSSKALVDWMVDQNAELAKRYEEEGADGSATASKRLSKPALAKAEKFGFYLGLDSAWLYQ